MWRSISSTNNETLNGSSSELHIVIYRNIYIMLCWFVYAAACAHGHNRQISTYMNRLCDAKGLHWWMFSIQQFLFFFVSLFSVLDFRLRLMCFVIEFPERTTFGIRIWLIPGKLAWSPEYGKLWYFLNILTTCGKIKSDENCLNWVTFIQFGFRFFSNWKVYAKNRINMFVYFHVGTDKIRF